MRYMTAADLGSGNGPPSKALGATAQALGDPEFRGTIELIDRVSGEVLIAMAAGRRQRFPWYQVEVEL